MREIKFRAWDKAAKKFRGLNGVQDLFSLRCDGYCHEDYILNQYTGMKDKNGVEIYEGDILACKFHPMWYERISWQGEHDAICEVYWDYCGFGLKIYGAEDKRFSSITLILDEEDDNRDLLVRMENSESSIIGNIYQNPELVAAMKLREQP